MRQEYDNIGRVILRREGDKFRIVTIQERINDQGALGKSKIPAVNPVEILNISAPVLINCYDPKNTDVLIKLYKEQSLWITGKAGSSFNVAIDDFNGILSLY